MLHFHVSRFSVWQSVIADWRVLLSGVISACSVPLDFSSLVWGGSHTAWLVTWLYEWVNLCSCFGDTIVQEHRDLQVVLRGILQQAEDIRDSVENFEENLCNHFDFCFNFCYSHPSNDFFLWVASQWLQGCLGVIIWTNNCKCINHNHSLRYQTVMCTIINMQDMVDATGKTDTSDAFCLLCSIAAHQAGNNIAGCQPFSCCCLLSCRVNENRCSDVYLKHLY